MIEQQQFKNVMDVHTIFKLLKSQQVSYSDFTTEQIYKLREAHGELFDDFYNKLPKKYPEDSKIISQSQIKVFLRCQRMWFFQSIKHVPKEPIDETWLKFGSVMVLVS